MPEENKQEAKPEQKPEQKQEQKPAEAPKAPQAEAAPAAAPKKEEKKEAKKEKPANCAACNKPIKKKRWYYRSGKYYCTKRCWKSTVKKEEKTEEAADASKK